MRDHLQELSEGQFLGGAHDATTLGLEGLRILCRDLKKNCITIENALVLFQQPHESRDENGKKRTLFLTHQYHDPVNH